MRAGGRRCCTASFALDILFFFLGIGFWVWKRMVMSSLEEKGFGFGREAICKYWKQKEEGNMGFWFGREKFWVWKRNRVRYRKKNEAGKKKKKRRYFSFNAV